MITLTDPALVVSAEVLDDLERTRIANQNRLRQLTRPAGELDSDGISRGFGLTDDHPDVLRLHALVDALVTLEKNAGKALDGQLKRHPLGPWVLDQHGVGLRQAARLLASVGDPYWHTVEDRPRKVGELLAYCGFREANGVAVRRAAGHHINWNPTAKSRTWLIATSCVKKRESPYRIVYDLARDRYAGAVHEAPCVRCGPSGHPAQVGSPLNPGHQHARAIRAVCKEILADLWRESRRRHGEAEES